MYLGQVPDEIQSLLATSAKYVKTAEKRMRKREPGPHVRADYERAADFAEQAAKMMRSYIDQVQAD